MNFDWLSLWNPVAIWWVFLIFVSTANVALWLTLLRYARIRTLARQRGALHVNLMVMLCAGYVFGCAFRSVLPRADVQRICLFDTWLSSVAVGRSVATVAEICFVVQWAIVLHLLANLANLAKSDPTRSLSRAIVPLILVAECCSWYSVITTSYLGNAVENSIWAVAFLFVAIALLRLLNEFRGVMRATIGIATAGIAGYLAFLVLIDVPMYLARWQADLASGKELFGVMAGLHDASTRWIATHDFTQWKDEIAWMSLYFSVAVWSSLALCSFPLLRDTLARYRASPARRLPARVGLGRSF